MAKKRLDDQKFLAVIICKNAAEAKQQSDYLLSKKFKLPVGASLALHSIVRDKRLATYLNDVQKRFDAKYKIYFNAPISHISDDFFANVSNSFFYEPGIAMVGFFGTEMPLSGDYTEAKECYGVYRFKFSGDEIRAYNGKTPLFSKSVHILESSFLATNEDIVWDERIGEDFLFVAQCCRYRNAGHKVAVIDQRDKPWLIFAKDDLSYTPKNDQKNYQKQLEQFKIFYNKKYLPLVSILIPAYNQPKFCMEALESALNQTYPNIEILIGDDSTNEETKKAVQPYLKKYKNIQYFYNDKKNHPDHDNFRFLLNKCNGEYINYLLHDDLLYPEKISKMMDYYIKDLDERISLITSARDAIDGDGKIMGRQNPWQPREDTILKGEEVGRSILFTVGNIIGELTTVMVRKRDLMVKNAKGERFFSAINFCGIVSRAYGDLDTWYNLLRKGDMVFIAESLSAFRHHAAQSTHKASTKLNLPADALNFVTIAWLNNVFLHSEEEFVYCCRKWLLYLQIFVGDNFQEDDTEEVKAFKQEMFDIRDCIVNNEGYEKIFNKAVTFLFDHLSEDKKLLNLAKKNETTGLWEKVDDGIFYIISQKFD